MNNRFKRLALWSAGLVLVWSGGAGAAQPLHHVSSEVCKECHGEIYK
ncbi:MAG: hypothetical protein GQ528_11015 [Woeseiaceae bacterium]|nr:hypothetical protein [Woeseiaceae bacterium]